jgi:hypothetical protein
MKELDLKIKNDTLEGYFKSQFGEVKKTQAHKMVL